MSIFRCVQHNVPSGGDYFRQFSPAAFSGDELGGGRRSCGGRETAPVAFPTDVTASPLIASPLSDDVYACCGAGGPVVPPPVPLTSFPVNGHLQRRRLDFRSADCDLNDSGYDGGLLTFSDVEFDADDSAESTAVQAATSSFFHTSPRAAFY